VRIVLGDLHQQRRHVFGEELTEVRRIGEQHFLDAGICAAALAASPA
jgi:hypothetical protein